jgi:Xaa-Pro aminopeptidase
MSKNNFLRIKAVRQILKNRHCTHLLVSDPVDAEYVSGFRASRVYLLISASHALLCTDFRYEQEARRFCSRNRQWQFCRIKGPGYSFLSAHARRAWRVGIQSDVVTVEEMAELKKTLRGARIVRIPGAVQAVAGVKTRPEIASIAAAGCCCQEAYSRFRRCLKPGMTEQEAAALLNALCRKCGSEKEPFDTIVLFGAGTALPHGRPGKRRLRRGHLVLADFGCTINGLCSDITRTVCCGRPSPRQKKMYALVKKAQMAALAAARRDVTGGDVDNAGRAIIAKAGFGRCFGHSLGHGLGRRVHEPPRIAAKSQDILEQGSVFTLEPGIYLPGWGGIRIEDMVVMTRTGAKLITSSPETLEEI